MLYIMDGRERTFRLADAAVAGLVAIGVILFLTASMARGREHAKRILCSVNMMKLHAAMSHYLADNEATYCNPLICLVNADWTGVPVQYQWHDPRVSPLYDERNAGLLWPYMQTQSFMVCATMRRYAELFWISPPSHHYPALPMEPQYSYSQNNFLGGSKSPGQPYGVFKESEVVRPEEVLVFAEETVWLIPGLANWILNDTCFMARHTHDYVPVGDTIATYHATTPERKNEGRGNAVFVDGHVELCDPWVRHDYEWGWLTESFYLAWPKGKVFTSAVPY